jgi:hypothetical protein
MSSSTSIASSSRRSSGGPVRAVLMSLLIASLALSPHLWLARRKEGRAKGGGSLWRCNR